MQREDKQLWNELMAIAVTFDPRFNPAAPRGTWRPEGAPTLEQWNDCAMLCGDIFKEHYLRLGLTAADVPVVLAILASAAYVARRDALAQRVVLTARACGNRDGFMTAGQGVNTAMLKSTMFNFTKDEYFSENPALMWWTHQRYVIPVMYQPLVRVYRVVVAEAPSERNFKRYVLSERRSLSLSPCATSCTRTGSRTC